MKCPAVSPRFFGSPKNHAESVRGPITFAIPLKNKISPPTRVTSTTHDNARHLQQRGYCSFSNGLRVPIVLPYIVVVSLAVCALCVVDSTPAWKMVENLPANANVSTTFLRVGEALEIPPLYHNTHSDYCSLRLSLGKTSFLMKETKKTINPYLRRLTQTRMNDTRRNPPRVPPRAVGNPQPSAPHHHLPRTDDCENRRWGSNALTRKLLCTASKKRKIYFFFLPK